MCELVFDLGTFSPSTMALNSSRLMLFFLAGIPLTGSVVARVAVVVVLEVVTGTVGVLLTAIKLIRTVTVILVLKTEHDLSVGLKFKEFKIRFIAKIECDCIIPLKTLTINVFYVDEERKTE